MRSLLIALLLVAGPAWAADPQGEFTPPDWLRKPTPDELSAFYPPGAVDKGEAGKAVIQCQVVETGMLEACDVVEESPRGAGFGEAAVKATSIMRMKPATLNGKVVPTPVSIPISFAPPPVVEVKNPDWKRKPSGDDLARFVPVEALRRGISGRGEVECQVMANGALEGCKVIHEDPPGLGFGIATLMASALFVMQPGTVNGAPVRRTVRIPVAFKVPEAWGSVSTTTVVARPIWEEAPSFQQVAAAWPERATADFGQATLSCRVTREGRLTSCRVTTQAPVGQGFGSAASRALAPLFKMRLSPEVALPRGGLHVEFPIHFTNPAAGMAPAIVEPRWITTLDPEKVAAVYPAAAAEAGIQTGQGVADCLVAVGGGLTACRPAEEDPKGYGFGQAAVAVASVMRMNPWSDGGGPVDGVRIKLPIRFNLSEGEPAPPQ
ncbi:MAG TPA: TonB family protein [Caulobacteraceae bacterium]